MPLKDLVKKLNIVKPRDIAIKLNEKKDTLTILLKRSSTVYTNVIPEVPFPISHPHFVILKKLNGADVCIIKDISKLDKISCENLKKLLDKLYFIPRIEKIVSLEASGDKFEWETITDKGRRRFNTKGRSSVIFIGDKIVISDTNDNIYQIDNIKSLDKRSRSIIQSIF
ncbi:TPA: DUF1854 domain-containing protein [Candidatus Bathyarchaeota archaeon]|nr:DUF1854 domain-containing protein [Candidatus Bathyarchaeota archaeon]